MTIRLRSPVDGSAVNITPGPLGVDELLHDHGDRGLSGHALAGAVADDPLAVQRRPAVDETLEHRGVADRRWRTSRACRRTTCRPCPRRWPTSARRRGRRRRAGGTRRAPARRARPARRPCGRAPATVAAASASASGSSAWVHASPNSARQFGADAAVVHRPQVAVGGDDEPGRDRQPAAVSSPRLAPFPPTVATSSRPDVAEPDHRVDPDVRFRRARRLRRLAPLARELVVLLHEVLLHASTTSCRSISGSSSISPLGSDGLVHVHSASAS